MARIISDKCKRCTGCGAEKVSQEFYSKGSRLDSICKECKKERSRSDYRFKFGPRDMQRFASLADLLLDFHLGRQQEVLGDIHVLMGRSIRGEGKR